MFEMTEDYNLLMVYYIIYISNCVGSFHLFPLFKNSLQKSMISSGNNCKYYINIVQTLGLGCINIVQTLG